MSKRCLVVLVVEVLKSFFIPNWGESEMYVFFINLGNEKERTIHMHFLSRGSGPYQYTCEALTHHGVIYIIRGTGFAYFKAFLIGYFFPQYFSLTCTVTCVSFITFFLNLQPIVFFLFRIASKKNIDDVTSEK